jgi:hypothetical protein
MTLIDGSDARRSGVVSIESTPLLTPSAVEALAEATQRPMYEPSSRSSETARSFFSAAASI